MDSSIPGCLGLEANDQTAKAESRHCGGVFAQTVVSSLQPSPSVASQGQSYFVLGGR